MANNAINNAQMNGQPAPTGQQPMNGTMNGQMNANWQPQPQMMRPPKQPMDPAKKKKLILGISLGVSGVVLAIIAVVVVIMLIKADYGASY